MENESDSKTIQGNNVVRNLNKDLDGHKIISNPVFDSKNPTKPKLSNHNGPRNQSKANMDLSVKPTQGPTRMAQGSKAASPSKNVSSSRDKGKAVSVAGPLKENRTQNNVVRSQQLDRGPVHKPIVLVPPARSGPDIQQQMVPTGISPEEVLRLMRYERQHLAEQ